MKKKTKTEVLSVGGTHYNYPELPTVDISGLRSKVDSILTKARESLIVIVYNNF